MIRPDGPLLPGHSRRRGRTSLHGSARSRTQLPAEDLLTGRRHDEFPDPRLFANDIDREIEEVIKVDQTDEEIIRSEIDEYVVTDAIADHYVDDSRALRREHRNKPHEGIAIWVSGFFGSGKSSFAKMLGLAIENRDDRR